MRRCPSVMNTTPVTTATNIAASTIRPSMPSLPPPPLSSSDACCSNSIAGARHAGQNAGHDQQADAVADAELVDLLAEPHQEHRAGGHRQNGGNLPIPDQMPPERSGTRAPPVPAPRRTTRCRTSFGTSKEERGVARVFVDFLAAGFAFLLQLLERRINAAQQLENDRGRDVRHDAQAEDRDIAAAGWR